MQKLKPYLLPGLLGFYVLFSVSMILVGKQVEDAGSPNTANPVFMASWLGLISQLVLVAVWAGFGPEPWLQRLPLCTLCGLLSLLAFEQTFYLMFGHTSYHYEGSDPIVPVLLGCPILVAWLCCLRAIPWLSWQIVRQPQQPLQHHPINWSTSRGRTILLAATACGTLIAADWAVIPGGFFRLIFHPGEYLSSLDRSIKLLPFEGPVLFFIEMAGVGLLAAVGLILLTSVTLSRFADWLLYRRYWTLPLVSTCLLSWLLWCSVDFPSLRFYPQYHVTVLLKTSTFVMAGILPMLLLGLAGYRLQSRKRPRADNQDTENTEKESSQDLAKSRSPLDAIVIVGSLAFMLVVVPTGFMRDLVVDTRVDRVHHILERLSDVRQGYLVYKEGHLVSVVLGNEDFTDNDMEVLTELDRLKDLTILESQITDAGLVHLEGLANLKSLTIGSTTITDAGLVHLKGLKNLTRLKLYCNQVSDAGLVHLKGLRVSVFTLESDRIDGSGFNKLRDSKNLRMVNIRGKNLTDQVFENLSHLTALRTIYLDSPKLQGDGLEELGHLRNLTTLNIGVFSNKGKSNLNPDYAENLKHLTPLECLELPNNAKLNDNTLKHIGVLRKLKRLNLRQSQITDAGLVHLKRLTNLEELWLNDTKITDAGVADLQKALPNCKISH